MDLTATCNDDSTCPVCNLTINRKFDMSRHMKQHRPDREELMHHCTHEGCSYKNLQKSNVVTHMRTHTGERNQLCPTCDFATSDPGSLTRHRKNRHGYEPVPRKPKSGTPRKNAERSTPVYQYDDTLPSPPAKFRIITPPPQPTSSLLSQQNLTGCNYRNDLTHAISSWLKDAWTPLMSGAVVSSSVLLHSSHKARISFRKYDSKSNNDRSGSPSQHQIYVWEIWLDARYVGGVSCPVRFWMEPVEWCLAPHDEKGVHSIDKDCIIWALTIVILANSQNSNCSELLHVRCHGKLQDSFALCDEGGSKVLVFGKRWGDEIDEMPLDD